MITPILHGVSTLVANPHHFGTAILETWCSGHSIYVDLLPDPLLTVSYFSRLLYTTCCNSPDCRGKGSGSLFLRHGLSVTNIAWLREEEVQNARILEGPGKKGSFTIQVLVTSSSLVQKF